MIYLFIGITLGVVAGYKLNDLVRKLNTGIELKIIGYNIYIGKKTKADVVPIKNKKPSKIKLDKKCETCNDEDMYIKGTKSLIPCPECNRNRDKFKLKVNC